MVTGVKWWPNVGSSRKRFQPHLQLQAPVIPARKRLEYREPTRWWRRGIIMDFLMSMRRLVSFSFVLESFDVDLTCMLDSQSPL